MAKKKEVDLSEFASIPSSELLIRLHAVKALKDTITADLIAAEFLRRDRVIVNESILGRPKMQSAPSVVEIAPKQVRTRKISRKNDCLNNLHKFNMLQESFFAGQLKTEMCSRCGKERIAK